MDIERLESSPVGQLVGIDGIDPRTKQEFHHFAFLPDPLPDEVQLSQETWTELYEAARAIGALKQACSFLPNPELLIAPALAKEAQATSALEGTYGALPDVLEARLPGFEPKTPEVREINAYVDMAHYAFDWVKDRPITVGMLCDLQKILADGSQRRPADPGHIRNGQVVIGPDGCTAVSYTHLTLPTIYSV